MNVDPWKTWGERWRRFQESYVPDRQRMIETIVRYVASSPRAQTANLLDLCCGPGSIADAILEALPSATATAVDCDPWLLELGRLTAANANRIDWVDCDLRDPRQTAELQGGSYDAITLVTALPWLDDDALFHTFSLASSLLAPGAILLIGDELPSGMSPVRKRAELALREWQAESQATGGIAWHAFWNEAAREPAFRALLAERSARLGPRRPSPPRGVDQIGHLLGQAGLGVSGEIWRMHGVAVILAQRPSDPDCGGS